MGFVQGDKHTIEVLLINLIGVGAMVNEVMCPSHLPYLPAQ